MMLSLDTAYRSFGGEVEASSTPTICRLPDSRRHQLSAIARPNDSATSELRCVKRLERIDISDGLRLLVPLEIAQRYVFGCKVSYQESVLFDRCDGLFHVQMLRWLRAYPTEFRGPAAIARAQGARENGDDGVIRKV